MAEKVAILVAKLLVTGACFWYVSRQIDLNQVLSVIPLLDFRWAAFAILVATLEIPLSGLRWYNIVGSLAARDMRAIRTAMIAATAVGVFFAQVLPSVAGDGVRAWLLVRLGSSWHNAVTSAVIDRGVGVGLMIVLGFVVLLLPSGLTALGGYRNVVLVVYGALILAGTFGLLLAPMIVLPLTRWRYSRWFARLATDARRVLFGSKGPVILSIGCHPNLDRRLGPAGARRDLAPCHLRRCAGKSVAIFGVLRPRAGTWLAAWSASLAFVSVSRPLGVLLSAATGPTVTLTHVLKPCSLDVGRVA